MATIKVKNNNGEWVDVALANTKGTLPEEALSISGVCNYKFSNNAWNWFVEQYGDKITTKDITNASSMFQNCNLEEIKFDINLASNPENSPIGDIFNSAQIKVAPNIVCNNLSKHIQFASVFYNCNYLKEIPESFVNLLEAEANIEGNNGIFQPYKTLFYGCYSLRKIPERVMLNMRNGNGGSYSYYYSIAYCTPFRGCYSLDELINFWCDDCNNMTSNQFSGNFENLGRAKNITFSTENGVPYIRTWKNQTVDLTKNVGYCPYPAYFTDYNSGITKDKEVRNDEAYHALKDDPDWFTTKVEYSRYNHDSAVNTINSLPDTSAYLATAGGTNTIKFLGAAGALTDGGAINTLTEEEIAVATAKGWSVAFV